MQFLAGARPESRWDPQLLAHAGLADHEHEHGGGHRARREPLADLEARGRLTTPTLLIQGRHDFLFDIDQALAAYKALKGPKRLYLGDLGHPPAANPQPSNRPTSDEA